MFSLCPFLKSHIYHVNDTWHIKCTQSDMYLHLKDDWCSLRNTGEFKATELHYLILTHQGKIPQDLTTADKRKTSLLCDQLRAKTEIIMSCPIRVITYFRRWWHIRIQQQQVDNQQKTLEISQATTKIIRTLYSSYSNMFWLTISQLEAIK
jgi:hypothetical protein